MNPLNYFDPQTLDLFYQLTGAAFLGAVLGAQRSVSHKMAGMRTYALITLGSALFTIISKLMVAEYANFSGINPLHMVAQIILGIGFIGGGQLIVSGSTVKGITTSAGIWVAAGIGMAVGFELYAIAIFTTIMTLLIFTVLFRFEEYIMKAEKTGMDCVIDEKGIPKCDPRD